ncbi:MAG: hypothetical protein MZV63_48715 [Marinilabiliales bacterium]|nr:hypothetical protein [Marinilabiliales bacterium]
MRAMALSLRKIRIRNKNHKLDSFKCRKEETRLLGAVAGERVIFRTAHNCDLNGTGNCSEADCGTCNPGFAWADSLAGEGDHLIIKGRCWRGIIFYITLPALLFTNFSKINLTPELLSGSLQTLLLSLFVLLFMLLVGMVTLKACGA